MLVMLSVYKQRGKISNLTFSSRVYLISSNRTSNIGTKTFSGIHLICPSCHTICDIYSVSVAACRKDMVSPEDVEYFECQQEMALELFQQYNTCERIIGTSLYSTPSIQHTSSSNYYNVLLGVFCMHII